jgi:pullulanase
VRLFLYDDSAPATTPTILPMTGDPATGVWRITGNSSWNRKFYLYEVTVWAPSTNAVETNLVTDPYSLSLSADSLRTQIVNLNDADLKPSGWDSLGKPELGAPEDVVLYELHVRDFSIADPSVPSSRRGTFAAFAQDGSNGMSHLKALADAGLTHIHLLPAFDFATVPERREDQLTTGDLSGFAPDAEDQQAAVAAIKDQDGFNWGYDPFHFTVPEGSYATNPDGVTRIREFRQMVRGLSRNGLRVVLDVVYNHTNSSGQNAKSVFDRIVPGYYHRLNGDGFVESSTCCANTASEHRMMGKLMVDSLVTWAKAYKVDGFRFDLMGHHMKSNLLEIQAALAALTPAADGVDGSKLYLYGEGWNFGEVVNNTRGVNATQLNMPGTGIGTFSDRLRDAVRGGNPFGGLTEQGFANGLAYDSNGQPQGDELAKMKLFTDQIMVGLAGNLASYPLTDRNGNAVLGSQIDYNGQPSGYTQDPQEVITYIEAHDNETLFDSNNLKLPLATSMADRVRVQNLGVSLVGLGQGIPFFHAGVDLLRSKSFDRDSFNSGDWFNQIDWTGADTGFGRGLPSAEKNQANWPLFQPFLANPALKPSLGDVEQAKEHLREILRLRKSTLLFRLPSGQDVIDRVAFHNVGPAMVPGVVVMSIADADGRFDRAWRAVVVVFNANDEMQTFSPAGLGDGFALHPVQQKSLDPLVRTAGYAAGTFTVPGRTTAVFVAKRPVAEQIALMKADLDAYVAAGELQAARAEQLKDRLDQALDALARGRTGQAIQRLEQFLRRVEQSLQQKRITEAAAAALTANAETAIDCLKG